MNFGGWQSVNAPCRDQRWLAVKDLRCAPLPGLRAVHDIHLWVRRNIRYEADAEDHWATPEETFGWRKGDCEDISILERALIIAAGWPSDSLWLVLVNDLIARQDHAVLVFERFMLDSRTDKILYAERAKDYRPIIAFCDDHCVTFGRSL